MRIDDSWLCQMLCIEWCLSNTVVATNNRLVLIIFSSYVIKFDFVYGNGPGARTKLWQLRSNGWRRLAVIFTKLTVSLVKLIHTEFAILPIIWKFMRDFGVFGILLLLLIIYQIMKLFFFSKILWLYCFWNGCNHFSCVIWSTNWFHNTFREYANSHIPAHARTHALRITQTIRSDGVNVKTRNQVVIAPRRMN